MKKIKELLKPFIFIIFGALLLLCFFNDLKEEDVYKLVIAIFAVVLSTYFLVVGILSVVLGDKLGRARGILNLVGVASYPLFMGIYFLLTLINNVSNGMDVGPNGWTIAILSVAAALGLGGLLFVAYFVRNKALHRITFLFGAIFVLALLLDILLDDSGAPEFLGLIRILDLVLYGCYTSMLFEVLSSLKENKPAKKEEAKEEQPAEEEKPEEQPAE